jgi:hypothetical protein
VAEKLKHHEPDCPCWGDIVEHSKDCANCECKVIRAEERKMRNYRKELGNA